MSSKYNLSILIPSRNEIWLGKTVQDILKNSGPKTEVICVIDGEGSIEDIPQDPRVTVVYLQKSIGQRAATNLACKLSKAKYVCKADAHCSFDKNFDSKLIADMQDDWVVVPLMRNLHAFDWVCDKGHRRYQGPSGPCINCKTCGHPEDQHNADKPIEGVCSAYKACGKPTTMDVLWKAKDSPKSRSYCFDSEPHFDYFGEYLKRPEVVAQGDINDTMSLQGSFFMMTRKKYWELDISSEKQFGSWGSQGIEISAKHWLSGSYVKCNSKTWYAHLFRTQGGDFSFPYKQDHSKALENRSIAKDLFFKSQWSKQIYPLSWMIEKFWPIVCSRGGWTDAEYLNQKAEELKTNRPGIASLEDRKTGNVYIIGCDNIRTGCLAVFDALNKNQHPNKEAQEAWNDHKDDFFWHVERFCRKDQVPHYEQQYIQSVLDGEFKKHPIIPSITKGILYYTDGELDGKIAEKVRNQIKKSGLPITSVSLKPLKFGDRSIHIKEKRGPLAMARQILAGLEAMTEDVVFFQEHDVWTPANSGYYEFNPPERDVIYYNRNVWHLRMSDGFAVSYDAKRLSQLCAYRETLIEHYKKKVKLLENTKYSPKIGHEPGTHNRPERVDDLKSAYWESPVPSIDIKHGGNYTAARWKQSEFRSQRSCQNWKEGFSIPKYGDTNKFIQKLLK